MYAQAIGACSLQQGGSRQDGAAAETSGTALPAARTPPPCATAERVSLWANLAEARLRLRLFPEAAAAAAEALALNPAHGKARCRRAKALAADQSTLAGVEAALAELDRCIQQPAAEVIGGAAESGVALASMTAERADARMVAKLARDFRAKRKQLVQQQSAGLQRAFAAGGAGLGASAALPQPPQRVPVIPMVNAPARDASYWDCGFVAAEGEEEGAESEAAIKI